VDPCSLNWNSGAVLALCLQFTSPAFQGLEAQVRSSTESSPTFTGLAWGIDSTEAQQELESQGFVFHKTRPLGYAVFMLSFRGDAFGLSAEISSEFHRTQGLRSVSLRFAADSSAERPHFEKLLDSLTAQHGPPSEVRRLATLPPAAFWGRIERGMLVLSAAIDPEFIIAQYRAPDPDAPNRWRSHVADSLKRSREPADRAHLPFELTVQPTMIYCPKAARGIGFSGAAEFEFTLTKYGQVGVNDASAVRFEHRRLERAAAEFLAECSFTSGFIDGFPVVVRMTMTIPFRR
jgi:hypothetical protein